MAIIEAIAIDIFKTLAVNIIEGKLKNISTINIFKTNNSDQFLKLNTLDLIKFYNKTEPFSYYIDINNLYVIPGSLILEDFFGHYLDELITENKIKYKYQETSFNLSNELLSFSKPVADIISKNKKLYNGNTVRLEDIKKDSERCYTIILQNATYYDGLKSNYALDIPIIDKNKTIREYLHDSNKLPKYKKSKLANHIGVVCMIETADGYLIAQKRSSQVANNANTLSSSSSGTVEDIDLVENDTNFFKNIFNSIKRETLYEIGVTIEAKKTIFMGGIRDFKRGGLTDFHFYTKINYNFSDVVKTLENAPENFETDQLVKFNISASSKEDFIFNIKDILLRKLNSNITFDAGLLLYTKYKLENKF